MPLANSETPLMIFWRSLNAALKADGLPELQFGEVRELYERAASEARQAVRRRMFREAA